jgi:hypothetical protein
MKTNKKRLTQAFAIILIVGIGQFSNLNHKMHIFEPFQMSATWNKDNVKTDSLPSNNKENKLVTYTRDIISTGIQHIISNL